METPSVHNVWAMIDVATLSGMQDMSRRYPGRFVGLTVHVFKAELSRFVPKSLVRSKSRCLGPVHLHIFFCVSENGHKMS